jgi:hypothetical protein
MPKLAISKDFLPDYAALDKPVRRKVEDVFAKFTEHTHAGLHLEKLAVARDPRVRTIRIDQQYRGILMKPERGDTYLLVRVLPHDKADHWVASNTFSVNVATGALEVENVVAIERQLQEAGSGAAGPAERLFAGRSAKDFTQLGLPDKLVPLLERIATDEELDGLLQALPQSQGDALRMLAAGYGVQEAWEELIADQPPGQVDTGDVEAALDRPASQSMFYVAQDADELLDVLNRPFDLWRTFLHPSQRRLAYRERYAGSVRVTGGAGTGKTVVAMHRAKALADGPGDQPILLTTFTRNLAAALEEDLRLLGPELLDRVEVLNVDRLAWRVVREGEGRTPAVANDVEQQRRWRDVVDELGLPFSPAFLQQEWLHVVLGQGITSRDAYLAAARPGRGIRLSRRQRVEVWKGIERFTNDLVAVGKRTHTQLADAAAGFLAERSVKPYAHVIIDEAQDLHPAQWRMLRAAVAEGPNDLFILADAHQRIYDNRVTLSSLGVNVRGRSYRLRLNYRTTHEILKRALDLLAGEVFDDLDSGDDTLRGYRSQFHGPPPRLQGFPSLQAEAAGLVQTVRDWLARGVPPEEIGVAARTARSAEDAHGALQTAGLAARLLGRDDRQSDRGRVNVGTMHRMKGLEFRCVAVVDASEARLPSPATVTPEDEDPVAHRQDLQRERCLLYVACTRARDDLVISWSGQPSPLLPPGLLITARTGTDASARRQ